MSLTLTQRPRNFASLSLVIAVSAAFAVVHLHEGRNSVDLLGTGAPGVVDVADRENFNAHGYHIAVFQVHARIYPQDGSSPIRWQVVPFFGEVKDSATGNDTFGTSEGADCTLRDLRIVRTAPHRPVTVVIAQRELGRSFADSAPVAFHYFDLRVNSQAVVGYPAYYFIQTKVVEAKRAYCDVDDAFDRELGLGKAGILTWSGPR